MGQIKQSKNEIVINNEGLSLFYKSIAILKPQNEIF